MTGQWKLSLIVLAATALRGWALRPEISRMVEVQTQASKKHRKGDDGVPQVDGEGERDEGDPPGNNEGVPPSNAEEAAQGDEGVTPGDNEGVPPSNAEEVAQGEAKGVSTGDNEGVPPSNAEAVAQGDDEGVSTGNNKGVPPSNAEAVAQGDEEGVSTGDNEGVSPGNAEEVPLGNDEGASPGDDKGVPSKGIEEFTGDEDDWVKEMEASSGLNIEASLQGWSDDEAGKVEEEAEDDEMDFSNTESKMLLRLTNSMLGEFDQMHIAPTEEEEHHPERTKEVRRHALENYVAHESEINKFEDHWEHVAGVEKAKEEEHLGPLEESWHHTQGHGR